MQNFKLSKLVILIVMTLFVYKIGDRVNQVINDERTCICAYDGFGYYMYLPHFLQKGNLDFSREWAAKEQSRTCGDVPIYQFEHHKNPNKLVDIYHMGLSYLEAPSFIIANWFAAGMDYEQDGFSKPFQIAYLLNAILFIFLGLLYLRKILLLFTNELSTALAILFLYIGTNVFITFSLQYDLTHLYLFTLNAIWIYHILKFRKDKITKHILYSALIFGLTVAVRPTQAAYGIIPLFIMYQHFGFSKVLWKKILFYPIAALIFNIPQILYWKIYGGSFLITNLHTEDLVLTDPNLYSFLFSFRKGWLIYTPFFLLIIPGFIKLWKTDKKLSQLLLGFTSLYIYIMSSWECWWYASSFSQRVMVDLYPVLILPIAVLFNISTIKERIAIYSFAIATSALSLFQSHQIEKGLLHTSDMTWSHYKYIFGKTNITNYHSRYLRINQGDLDWMERYKQNPDPNYTIKEVDLFSLKQPLIFEANQDKTIGRIPIYDLLPSDESLIEVTIKTKTEDSTKSIRLQMETVSKYNCYGWDSFEVSENSPSKEFTIQTFKFNIPNMRHQRDELQMYFYCPEPVGITLEEMEIKAYSLVR